MNKKSMTRTVFALLGVAVLGAAIFYFAEKGVFSREVVALDQTSRALVVNGDVQIKKAGGTGWQKMASSAVIEKGDMIKTAMDSTVDICIGKNAEKAVKIKGDTSVAFEGINPTALDLPQGKILVMLKKLEPKSSFVVKTPTAICGARGTAWLQEASPDKTRISVFDSEVFTRRLSLSGSPEWRKHTVIQGTQVVISKSGAMAKPEAINESDMQDWRYWRKTVEYLRSGRLLVNDFDRRENFNNLGLPFGSWNVFYSDLDQYCRDEFTAREMVGDKGFGLKLTYDVNTPFSAYNGFFTRLGGVNVSDYKYLVFYVKGDKIAGFTTHINIELKNDRQTGRTVVKGITDQWQKVSVPLTTFAGMNSFEEMKEFVIVFSDNNVTKKEGVIYIDDIYFSKDETDKEKTNG